MLTNDKQIKRTNTERRQESYSPQKRIEFSRSPKKSPPQQKSRSPNLDQQQSKKIIKKAATTSEELMNKYQLSLANYIKTNKNEIRLSGTKRFKDKSGEYYLKNVLFAKKTFNKKFTKKLSLSQPQNIFTCMQKLNGTKKLEQRVDNLITKLPMNSLTPIPMMEEKQFKNKNDLTQLNKAERTAVHIRRIEYSTGIKNRKKNQINKIDTKSLQKIIFIQNWWKILFKILRIQKCFRGFLFRKQLLEDLENQEILINNFFYIDDLFIKFYYKKLFNYLKYFYKGKKINKILKNLEKKELNQRLSRWERITKLEKSIEKIESKRINNLTIQNCNFIINQKDSEESPFDLDYKHIKKSNSNDLEIEYPATISYTKFSLIRRNTTTEDSDQLNKFKRTFNNEKFNIKINQTEGNKNEKDAEIDAGNNVQNKIESRIAKHSTITHHIMQNNLFHLMK